MSLRHYFWASGKVFGQTFSMIRSMIFGMIRSHEHLIVVTIFNYKN